MKKRTLVISSILLSSTMFVTGALAASNGFSIFINGSKLSTEAKIINGTTYVPLRAISESLGAQVSVNNSHKNIYISTNTANPESSSQQNVDKTPAPPNSIRVASRTNPASIGEPVSFEQKTSKNIVNGKITITEVIRGDSAWKILHQTNRYNDIPDPGYEYMLAKIKYEVISSANSEAAVSVNKFDFTMVSESGADYQRVSVVLPDPEFRTKIYEGGSYEGWTAYLVKTSDSHPLLTYSRNSDGSNGVWFKTK